MHVQHREEEMKQRRRSIWKDAVSFKECMKCGLGFLSSDIACIGARQAGLCIGTGRFVPMELFL